MMANSSSTAKQNFTRSFPVHFEGGLQSCVRAELIAELTKYILFERQQIPLSYEHLKKHSNYLQSLQESGSTHRRWSPVEQERKKMLDVIGKVDQTLKGIKDAFDTCPEIKLAAIVLGPTPVSPKEVYQIQLPPLNPDADNLPVKSCMKSLFRELVLSDPLGNAKQLHPTNAFLLLYAPRDSNLSWFCPKPLYKLPTRGNQFHINLISSYDEGNADLTKELTIAELSGFEILDGSLLDTSHTDFSTDVAAGLGSASSGSSVSSEYVCIEHDTDYSVDNSQRTMNDRPVSEGSEGDQSVTKTLSRSTSANSLLSQTSVIKKSESDTAANSSNTEVSDLIDNDSDNQYIWFQAPVIIKGYKPKIFKN